MWSGCGHKVTPLLKSLRTPNPRISKKRKYSALYCPHCDSKVSKSTWYEHHRQYYDPVNKKWLNDVRRSADAERDFDFNGSSGEDNDGDHLHQNLETYHCELSLDTSSEEVSFKN